MVDITQVFNNWARGKVDHDGNGRYELPIYANGADIFNNWITNFKGNAIYRPGMEFMLPFEDCAMYEFVFNQEQNYILLFTEKKLKFATYAGDGTFQMVQKDGADVELPTPYTLEEAKELDMTQDFDLMYIVHENHKPQTLKRTAADAFEFKAAVLKGDPFDDPSTGSVGYPSCVTFYRGRLYFAGATKQITTVWASKANEYDQFTIPSDIKPDDPIKLRLTDIKEKIEWIYPGEGSLVVGSRDGIIPINGGSYNEGITSENVTANISSIDGASYVHPTRKDGNVFYISHNGRYVFWFRYDLLTESFKANNAALVSYDITKGKIKKIKHKRDKNDLMFFITETGKLLTLNFSEDEGIIGWHTHETNGKVHDIVNITNNEGDPQIFLLVERLGEYYIERFSDLVEFSYLSEFFTGDKNKDFDAYLRTVAYQLRDCNFLDNSILKTGFKSVKIVFDGNDTITADEDVFDAANVGRHIEFKTVTGYEHGRFEITEFVDARNVKVKVLIDPSVTESSTWYLSFNKITGLERFNGQKVALIDDGGFYDDVLVENGTIDLSSGNVAAEMSTARVGYKYRGTIKTFTVGFGIQNGDNTQKNQKMAKRFYVRAVGSAGGKIGTDPYNLENIQKISTKGSLNYLPTELIDGTMEIVKGDTNGIDKSIYIVQDLPLPFNLTALFVDIEHGSLK